MKERASKGQSAAGSPREGEMGKQNEEQPPEPKQVRDERSRHDPGRRRFNQAALGSVPVLMTIHSSPLRASSGATPGNCHPSGWVSGGSQYNDADDCGGEEIENLQVGDDSSEFSEVFSEVRNKYFEDDEATSPLSIEHAISDQAVYDRNGFKVEDDERDVIRYGAAAWVNQDEGNYTYNRPSAEEIKDLVTAAINDGYYETDAGDKLTLEGVVDFLKNTMEEASFKNT